MSTKPELLSLDAALRHWAAVQPDAPAIQMEDRLWSYGDLEERTARVATALLAKGLKKGDRIAWIGKNSDLYFTLFYGAARAGIVIAPVGWRLAPPEWAYILNDTGAKIVFLGPDFEGAASAVRDDAPGVQAFMTADETLAMIETTGRADFEVADLQDAVLQLYTSGTTGNPKGVELTNHNLFGLRKAAQDAELPHLQYGDDEVMLVAMPCAHIGGTGLALVALSSGLKALVQAEFTPDGFFDAVEQEGVTRLFIVPAALQILLNHPRCASVDFSGLKYILYGAAPIPLELLRQCIEMFGAQFVQNYGMTETTGTIVYLPPEDHDPNGSPRMRAAGIPMPGVEIRVVDAQGNDVPTGAVGEVVTRSSSNMPGYWQRPDATAETIEADGWLHTGDAGYLDEDGYLYIHDRVKDMIISGGENVYPAEVESAIYGHPDVLEVAVIGVPDEKWGEAVKAVCAPKEGKSIDANSIIDYARERIAGFKVPKSVDIVVALPRNPSGKILRKELRAPYWEGYDRQVN